MNSKKLNIMFQPTRRGFLKAEFKDLYGDSCSIQMSSLADERAIWIGRDGGTHYKTGNGHQVIDLEKDGYDCVARMHLSRKQVAELIPILQFFVDNGNLPIKKLK